MNDLFELLSSFLAFFSGSDPSGRQGPPRDPKLTILAPKMYPQTSKNGAQDTPRATKSDSKHDFQIDRYLKADFETYKVIPKKIYTKEVLRRCSALACSIRRGIPLCECHRRRARPPCQVLSGPAPRWRRPFGGISYGKPPPKPLLTDPQKSRKTEFAYLPCENLVFDDKSSFYHSPTRARFCRLSPFLWSPFAFKTGFGF